jgi:hypothetical protein
VHDENHRKILLDHDASSVTNLGLFNRKPSLAQTIFEVYYWPNLNRGSDLHHRYRPRENVTILQSEQLAQNANFVKYVKG